MQHGLPEDDLGRVRLYVEQALGAGRLKLPPEPKLCEELGVTRGRLRTLLKRLEDDGAIWRHVGKGTFVGPREINPAQDDLSASISPDAIIEARLLLEPQLAAQAASRATAADLATMDGCLDEMCEAPNFVQWKRLDEKLHRTIAEAGHNVLLLMLYDTLRAQIRLRLDDRMKTVFSAPSDAKQSSDAEHRAIVAAIRAQDPVAAEQAMRAHLRSVRTYLFGAR